MSENKTPKPPSRSPSGPVLSSAGAREAEERRHRQAQALRANLARRKARGRALEAAESDANAAPEPLESQAVSKPPPGRSGGA